MKQLIFLTSCLACLLVPSLAPAETEEAKSRFVPWSGYWWPHQDGGIVEPLRKYDKLTGRKAAAVEAKNYPAGPDVPEWAGYCHGWSASAVMEKEPRRATTPSGGAQVELAIGDQKALLAACHTKDANHFYGVRNEGQEGADPQGLHVDHLWRLLKLYVKQQGVPLILDIDPTPAVWNYPVYAYRVEYSPAESGNEVEGRMTLWLADDAVPPDFVGTKVRAQTYHFTCRMQNGSVIMGSGKWVGPSLTDHPDFAWYPYAAMSDNSEVDHATVLKLVADGATGGAGAGGDYDPSDPTPSDNLPGNPPGNPPGNQRPLALSPTELLALVANRQSSFDFDVTVDRFDGGQYTEGENLMIRGSSDRAGYLYLFHIGPANPNKPDELSLSLLFPRPGQDNRIPAKRQFEVPGSKDKFKLAVTGPQGTHLIKAIVTTRPLALTGLDQTRKTKGKGKAQQSQSFLLPPKQKQQVQEVVQKVRQGKMKPEQVEEWARVKPHKLIGEFAQDEVPYYVDSRGKPRQKE